MPFNFLFTLRTKFLDAIFISQKSLLVSCQVLFYSEQTPPFTFPRLKVHLLTTWGHCNSNENMIYYMYRSHPANLASLCMKPTRSIKKVTQATQIHIHTEAWVYIPVNNFWLDIYNYEPILHPMLFLYCKSPSKYYRTKSSLVMQD